VDKLRTNCQQLHEANAHGFIVKIGKIQRHCILFELALKCREFRGVREMSWMRRGSTLETRVDPVGPIPAAQYVRMSDDVQQYSIENQKTAIQEYAAKHGFVVIKTYADPGKSGVLAKNRRALRELLKDVVGGDAQFKAILVYDVSRWGRFPNNDEAAYYEFLCAKSGIPLHYCAEPFTNDGTAISSLLKALKRSMAAEFSRELGEKVFRGKTRIIQLGFRVGGHAGYGYRRLMVSADNKPKQQMKTGEHKSFTTDRVILVPGPRKEVEGIKEMFAMAIQRKGCTEIARQLNLKGFTKEGRPWADQTVYNAVTNPKYVGHNVWGRTSERLSTARITVPPHEWVVKLGAFESLVDQQTFDLAQARLPKIADYRWTDEQILKRARQLIKTKGRISEMLILKARNMPSPYTIHKHFGSYRQFYERLGFHLEEKDFYRRAQGKRSLRLRRKLVSKIKHLFPDHVEITCVPKCTRSMLRIDNTFLVSILLCRTKYRGTRGLHWVVEPNPLERDYITLFCKMSPTHDHVLSYNLFAEMNFKSHRSHENDPWLKNSIGLQKLSDFYLTVKTLWSQKTET
jgi:DNA invertase Pin-like site-specific DNA recombinase